MGPHRHGGGPPPVADVSAVVPVPPGEEGWLVSASDLDGEPLVVHAARTAAEVAADVVVVLPRGARDGLRRHLDAAGLDRVRTWDHEDGGAAGHTLADLLPASPGGAVRAQLVHDPLCPLAPAAFLREVLDRLRGPGGYRAGCGVHPMTDTVKAVRRAGDAVELAQTVDRERLRVVTSPLVVPVDHAALVPAHADVPGMVRGLRKAADVELVTAPPLVRRVHDRASLLLAMGLRDVEERSVTR